MYEDIFSTEPEAFPAADSGAVGGKRRSSWSSDEDDAAGSSNLFSDHPPLPGGLVFPEAEDVEAVSDMFGASLLEPPTVPSHDPAPVSLACSVPPPC